MDIDAERERIRQEIEELERSLGPRVPSVEVEVSGSSLESGSDDDDDEDGLEDDSDSDIRVEMASTHSEVDPAGGSGADEHVEGDADLRLPQTPETCLQMNLVYQEVIQEKLEELHLLLAQNKEQQEKLTWQLAGKQGTKSSDGKTVPANMFLGHFMKPYFKDKVSGVGPPANADTREKTTQGIKSFEELVTVKWKSREKLLLWQSVVSDHLQRLLQPKLLKLDYLSGKQAKAKDDVDRQILAKQIQETEREISDINQLPEETLLGNRSDEHDWDKIANINFEGTRNATELRKYWQNSEHPSISKKEWSQEEIGRLQEVAARHNLVDWQAIAQELGSQRSPFQCLQKFQACNKDFKRCEWTPEEDQMLFQLVQEMRVGEHIPYRKIAYYMEGRDSAQLIYRWTKRVDPNVKRGAWTPEEDALLLKAVAKYRERDWYKIRAEVPGRSDNQCRDRYLNSLHYDIKKGKWSQEEERSLIELTEKYGVGPLALQLLRIDVDGCMTVIRKRKRQLELLEAVVGRTEQASPAQEPAGQTPSLPPGKKLVPLKAKEGPGVPACPWRALLPPRPPPKPKTVSELLREKRLREAKTRRLEQRRLLLAPRLLLPPTVLLQQAPASACQALGQPGPPSSAQAGPLLPPAPAPAPPLPSAGSSGASLQGSAGASREPGLGGGSPERSREAPEVAGCPPPALPPPGAAAPPPWPAPSGGSTLVAPSPVPAFCPQQSPVTLLPTLLAPRPAAPKQVLPLTWLLTPQGFVPLALVGLPQQGEPPSAPAAEARGVVAAGAGSGTPPPGAQAPWASAGSPQQGGASRPPDPSPAPAATAQPPSAASPHPAPGPAQPPASTGPLPQPHGARPAQPQEEAAAAPDYSLVSLEGGAAVREWAQGGPKVSSPPGDASLPYLPPSLCSLRTLAALLRSKGALERSAAALALPGEEPGQPRLDTLRAAVRQRLSANPAYQLLRARFLAALTFPAALAALAPSRVPTTLRGGRQGVDSSDDSGLEEEEEEEEEEEGGGSGETTAGGGAGRAPGHEEAAAAGRRQEGPQHPWGTASPLPAYYTRYSYGTRISRLQEPSSDSADSDHRSKPSVRRSSRLQKRRRRRW
ncbi:hypothetical protein lerEdw1_009340 [Lerista edwardsae]|nr:hypothetical protein lerEdw1_009340 [Lerista edwardsae]